MGPGSVIDVHSHLYLARAEGGGLKILPQGIPDWSVEKILAMMDANNIGATILSQPNPRTWHDPATAREINLAYAKIIADHPDRFGAFAVLPLGDMDATLTELEHALDRLKFDGVLLNTNVEGEYLGEAPFHPLWAELDRRRAVAFVHPTLPQKVEVADLGINGSIIEYMFDTTRFVTNMVYEGTRRRYPHATIISTHGGGAIPYLAWRISYFATLYGTEKNNVGGGLEDFDVIMRELKSFHFDLTASMTPYALPSILEHVPPSQLLMGFDYPMMTVPHILPAQRQVLDCPALSDADKTAIFSGNARRLFPRLGGRRG